MQLYIYIWRNVDHLTYSYHEDGGLVVVSYSLEKAREYLLSDDPENKYLPLRPECEAFSKEPDQVYALQGEPVQQAFIFPDAGCC